MILRLLLCSLLCQESSGFLSAIFARVQASLRGRSSSLAFTILFREERSKVLAKSAGFQPHETIECTTDRLTSDGDCKATAPEISPYYRRDRNDNSTAPIPPAEVLGAMLEKRWRAKQEKDPSKVREMNRQLRCDFGIYVYDQPPIWTRQVEPPLAHFRKQAELRHSKRKELYGPRGHPFENVGGGDVRGSIEDPMVCSLSEPTVHHMLGQWVEYSTKANDQRQQERANAIRFELSLHGIIINTTCLQWTTDEDYVFNGIEKTMENMSLCSYTGPVYREDHSSTKLGEPSQENRKLRQRIEHLIERRSEAELTGWKRDQLFIEWELKQSYGVQLNDRTRTWYMDERAANSTTADSSMDALLSAISTTQHQQPTPIINVSFPPLLFGRDASIWDSPAYRQSAASQKNQTPAIIASRVCDLVQERIHKREESKYVEADAIRRELWRTYNAGVNDRLQQFSIGGTFDSDD